MTTFKPSPGTSLNDSLGLVTASAIIEAQYDIAMPLIDLGDIFAASPSNNSENSTSASKADSDRAEILNTPVP